MGIVALGHGHVDQRHRGEPEVVLDHGRAGVGLGDLVDSEDRAVGRAELGDAELAGHLVGAEGGHQVVADRGEDHDLVGRGAGQGIVDDVAGVARGLGAVPQDLDELEDEAGVELVVVGLVGQARQRTPGFAAVEQQGVGLAGDGQDAALDVVGQGHVGGADDPALAGAEVVGSVGVDQQGLEVGADEARGAGELGLHDRHERQGVEDPLREAIDDRVPLVDAPGLEQPGDVQHVLVGHADPRRGEGDEVVVDGELGEQVVVDVLEGPEQAVPKLEQAGGFFEGRIGDQGHEGVGGDGVGLWEPVRAQGHEPAGPGVVQEQGHVDLSGHAHGQAGQGIELDHGDAEVRALAEHGHALVAHVDQAFGDVGVAGGREVPGELEVAALDPRLVEA